MKSSSMEEFHEHPDELVVAARNEVQVVRDEDGVVVTLGVDGTVPPIEDRDTDGPTVDYASVTTPQGGAVKPEGYFASN